jgi:flagellar biosynthesis/type III secretory pathway protein FliH
MLENSQNKRKLHESMGSLNECKKVLDEVLAASEKCEKGRDGVYTKGYTKGYAKGYDEGYVQGFSDGVNSD